MSTQRLVDQRLVDQRLSINGWFRARALMELEKEEEAHIRIQIKSEIPLRHKIYTQELHRRQSDANLPLRALVLVRSSLNREFQTYQKKTIEVVRAQRKARDSEWEQFIDSILSETHRSVFMDMHADYKNARIPMPDIVPMPDIMPMF